MVPLKLGCALSHSSSGLLMSGRGCFSPEESLEKDNRITKHQGCRKRNRKSKVSTYELSSVRRTLGSKKSEETRALFDGGAAGPCTDEIGRAHV